MLMIKSEADNNHANGDRVVLFHSRLLHESLFCVPRCRVLISLRRESLYSVSVHISYLLT
jgi:hypothetical protein